jgi:predicted acyltransferase
MGVPTTNGITATRPEAASFPDRKVHVPQPQAPAGEDRLVSLDAYRGFTMLAMVSSGLGMAGLLLHPTWGWLADQMRHRDWEGCTFWDLIQPSFMFIVGVAMPFAFARRQERGDSWARQFGHAVKRAFLLICIGVFLDCYADGVFYVQFIRVLQQIAIGYLLAFLVLHRGPYVQAATAAGFLLLHAVAFILYGFFQGTDPWVKDLNLGTYVDQLLGLRLSPGGYVTLNALSSAATILFGVLAGELLRGPWSRARKLGILILAGLAGLAVGGALGGMPFGDRFLIEPVVPMVKKLWTASFGIYAAGWTCLMLAGFFLVIDIVGFRSWAFPFVVVGMNSIAIYVSAGIMGGTIRRALKPFVGPSVAELDVLAQPVVWAVLIVLVQWLFCLWLYRHRIFFKV